MHVSGDGSGFQGGKPLRGALGVYAKQPVSFSVGLVMTGVKQIWMHVTDV